MDTHSEETDLAGSRRSVVGQGIIVRVSRTASSWRRFAGGAVAAVAVATAVAVTAGALPANAADGLIADPDQATTAAGAPVDIDVTANDTTTSSDPIIVTSTSEAGHGTATVLSASTVRYQPEAGFVGDDTFQYRVRSAGARAIGSVTVTVTPAADHPLTVVLPTKWIVLRPGAMSGEAAPGADLSVRITGPRTDTTLAVESAPDGTWTAQFTPRWAGTHTVTVTEESGSSGRSATATVTAKARYLTSQSRPLTAADVPYSYRPGCPVAPAQLRNLTITYWDWNDQLRTGVLVVNRRAVKDLRYVFRVAFRTKFPIRSVNPAEKYYDDGRRTSAQSDKRAMAADNTSAFNCRRVTGSHYRRSPHSFGTSIDINPRENPYVTHRRVYPKHARTFLNRSKVRKGMLVRSTPVVKAFKRRGWVWGTRFRYPDYQHFDM